MEDQYQTIGNKYNAVKLKPSVAFTEVAAVFRMLGDVNGIRALDLACGTGFYSRQIRRRGANKVVGVDLSQTMIDVAKAQEFTDPLGIEYQVADVASMGSIGTFEVATAVWLLHYANTEDELSAMCHNIGRNLVLGGRLIAVIPNPDFINALGDTELYQFRTRILNPDDPVAHVRMDIVGEESFSFNYTQWPFEAYTDALHHAGFRSIQCHAIGVSSEGIENMGEDYWRCFRNNPISLGLTASYQG